MTTDHRRQTTEAAIVSLLGFTSLVARFAYFLFGPSNGISMGNSGVGTVQVKNIY